MDRFFGGFRYLIIKFCVILLHLVQKQIMISFLHSFLIYRLILEPHENSSQQAIFVHFLFENFFVGINFLLCFFQVWLPRFDNLCSGLPTFFFFFLRFLRLWRRWQILIQLDERRLIEIIIFNWLHAIRINSNFLFFLFAFFYRNFSTKIECRLLVYDLRNFLEIQSFFTLIQFWNFCGHFIAHDLSRLTILEKVVGFRFVIFNLILFLFGVISRG
jgi:hypothetical protein